MTFDPSSREAEAQAEIAATRLGRGVARALAVGGGLLLASGPLIELPAVARGASEIAAAFAAVAPDAGRLDIVRARIDAIERRFDERSALVRWIRPRAQALLTRFGGYGNEQVVVGRDGWLFFRDDVEHLTSRRPGPDYSGDPVGVAARFRDALAARGVGLLVLPTPLKPTVHPEKLARGAAEAPVRREGEAELFARLALAGVETLDLAPRFARDGRLAPLYLATDTHWRPEAVEIAARELSILLRERYELPPGDPALRLGATERRSASGDTAAMLELPPGSAAAASETVTARPPGATSDDPSQVLVLGDSFARIYSAPDLGWGANAGLADRLAGQLGLPVDRIVRNAGGASATREAFAEAWRREPERFAVLRVVVWQFAVRELSQGSWRDTPLPESTPQPR